MEGGAVRRTPLEHSEEKKKKKISCEVQTWLAYDDAKVYQSVAASLNFIAPDKPDILYATKELMRAMSRPCVEDELSLKRLLRYLKGHGDTRIHLSRHATRTAVIHVYVDSDFAGCRKSRKSTAGGCVMFDGHLMKAWSKTMATLALSTGEAELGALTKGAAEGLGMQSLMGDLGITAAIKIISDATAAIGIASRQGLGKLRHISVADLWVQQKVKRGVLAMEKIPGRENPADLMTKGIEGDRIPLLLDKVGVKRAGVAARAADLSYVKDRSDGECST